MKFITVLIIAFITPFILYITGQVIDHFLDTTLTPYFLVFHTLFLYEIVKIKYAQVTSYKYHPIILYSLISTIYGLIIIFCIDSCFPEYIEIVNNAIGYQESPYKLFFYANLCIIGVDSIWYFLNVAYKEHTGENFSETIERLMH